MSYLNEDFLLKNEVAKEIYNNYSKALPIIDYHCHLDPKEIFLDKRYSDLAEIWLLSDHYKWRVMRKAGIEEKYITGDASNYEKFKAYISALELAIGNPLYSWSHLELKRYFNYDGEMNLANCDNIWEHCDKYLKENIVSPRSLILGSNVEVICTTDDPIDSLEWHKKIALDETFNVKVLPSFRPDKAINIEKDGFREYIEKLSDVTSIKIDSIYSLINALYLRIDYFVSLGCKVTDHGLDYLCFSECSELEANNIFLKRLNGEELSDAEIERFKTYMLLNLAKKYKERNLVMQLHFGVERNINSKMFNILGPDSGFDVVGRYVEPKKLAKLVDKLSRIKVILYSLNENDNAILDTIAGSFRNVEHGAAWWFNDNKEGIINHLKSYAALSNIGSFLGMLTDSRSFLSYTRHEYFRRIFCNLLGEYVENGEYPKDLDVLKKIVTNVCYANAKKYFEF